MDGGPRDRESQAQDGADAHKGTEPEDREAGRRALTAALDDYRAGQKDLHDAAREAGVASWDLLEAVQATPDPMVVEQQNESTGLPTFVRRRTD